MKRIVYEVEQVVPVDLERDDNGASLVWEPQDGTNTRMFVRVQSWDERAWRADPDAHVEIRSLSGKRVRVTIATVDDTPIDDTVTQTDRDLLFDFLMLSTDEPFREQIRENMNRGEYDAMPMMKLAAFARQHYCEVT